jgi:hypothetical protein
LNAINFREIPKTEGGKKQKRWRQCGADTQRRFYKMHAANEVAAINHYDGNTRSINGITDSVGAIFAVFSYLQTMFALRQGR